MRKHRRRHDLTHFTESFCNGTFFIGAVLLIEMAIMDYFLG